jgi:WD40 repeat protein
MQHSHGSAEPDSKGEAASKLWRLQRISRQNHSDARKKRHHWYRWEGKVKFKFLRRYCKKKNRCSKKRNCRWKKRNCVSSARSRRLRWEQRMQKQWNTLPFSRFSGLENRTRREEPQTMARSESKTATWAATRLEGQKGASETVVQKLKTMTGNQAAEALAAVTTMAGQKASELTDPFDIEHRFAETPERAVVAADAAVNSQRNSMMAEVSMVGADLIVEAVAGGHMQTKETSQISTRLEAAASRRICGEAKEATCIILRQSETTTENASTMAAMTMEIEWTEAAATRRCIDKAGIAVHQLRQPPEGSKEAEKGKNSASECVPAMAEDISVEQLRLAEVGMCSNEQRLPNMFHEAAIECLRYFHSISLRPFPSKPTDLDPWLKSSLQLNPGSILRLLCSKYKQKYVRWELIVKLKALNCVYESGGKLVWVLTKIDELLSSTSAFPCTKAESEPNQILGQHNSPLYSLGNLKPVPQHSSAHLSSMFEGALLTGVFENTEDLSPVRFVLVGSSPGALYTVSQCDVTVWSTAQIKSNSEPLKRMTMRSGARVTSIVLSRNGQLICSSMSELTIWNMKTESDIPEMVIPIDPWICDISLSDDCNLLSIGGKGIKIFDMISKRVIQSFDSDDTLIYCVAFSPCSELIAGGTSDHDLKLWCSTSGRCKNTLRINKCFHGLIFSPDGERLSAACAAPDACIVIWSTADFSRSEQLTGHTDSVNQMAYSLDSSILVSASDDETVRIWCTLSMRCLAVLDGHQSAVNSVSLSRDSSTLATASQNGTVSVWSLIFLAKEAATSLATASPSSGKPTTLSSLDKTTALSGNTTALPSGSSGNATELSLSEQPKLSKKDRRELQVQKSLSIFI